MRTAHTSSASSTRVCGRSGSSAVAAAQSRDPLVRAWREIRGGGRRRPSTSRWRRAPRRSRACPRRSAGGCARRRGRRARSRRAPRARSHAGRPGPAAAATRRARSAPASASRTCHGSPPRAVVADRRHVAPDEVAGQRRRVEVAAHGDERPRPVDERVEPHPLEARRGRRCPWNAHSVARERSTPTERARRTMSAPDPARPSARRWSSRARSADGTSSLRRLGGHRHREQERRLVDGEQVELVAPAGKDVEARGGVDRPGVKRRRQTLAMAVERVHERHVEPVLGRGCDRRAVGALEQHLSLEHVAQRGNESRPGRGPRGPPRGAGPGVRPPGAGLRARSRRAARARRA